MLPDDARALYSGPTHGYWERLPAFRKEFLCPFYFKRGARSTTFLIGIHPKKVSFGDWAKPRPKKSYLTPCHQTKHPNGPKGAKDSKESARLDWWCWTFVDSDLIPEDSISHAERMSGAAPHSGQPPVSTDSFVVAPGRGPVVLWGMQCLACHPNVGGITVTASQIKAHTCGQSACHVQGLLSLTRPVCS